MKLKSSDIIFKKCDLKNIEEICELQEIAFLNLDNKNLLRRNTREMLENCLSSPHYTLGAFFKGELIAFGILFDAGETEENIGLDIGLTGSDLNKVANIKLIIVLPEYRGNGLQRRLMTFLEGIAKRNGKEIVCGTVSPENLHSCNNFTALSYNLETTKIKYNGLERNIYYKKI